MNISGPMSGAERVLELILLGCGGTYSKSRHVWNLCPYTLMCTRYAVQQQQSRVCYIKCAFHQQLAVPRSVSTVDVSLRTVASVREAGEATTVPAV